MTNEITSLLQALGRNDNERGKLLGICGRSAQRLRANGTLPRPIAKQLRDEPDLTLADLIRRAIPTITASTSDATPTIPDSTDRT